MKILFVCLGNICRSPMAEFICKDLLKDNKNIEIDSAGTSGYHDGDDMHSGTKKLLKEKNIFCDGFSSKKISKSLIFESDFILVMDDQNLKTLINKFGENNKIKKITNYSSNKTIEYVPDP